ncbi:hypothetical protein STEG23_027121 [Scotinomys teguina]
MERDRRRKIGICCDELNLLVPFCNAETHKATTPRWTTALLKYIQERHGDSLKEEFESVFCDQIKPGHNGVMIHNKKGSKTGKTQRSESSDVHQPPTVIIRKSNAAS